MVFESIATADGNIGWALFVKVSTTDNRVLQAGAGDAPIGISQKGTRRVPYAGLDDGYAAIAGEGLVVHQEAGLAPLRIGGTVAAGDKLKPDSNGMGVTASTGNLYGAITPKAAKAGDVIEVLVHLGTL